MNWIVDGIQMQVWQQPRGKNRHRHWYGQYRDASGTLQRCYIGRELPGSDQAQDDTSQPPSPDGVPLFRCCRCGGHPTDNEFFVICSACRTELTSGPLLPT
jgi:hypothetical protein